MANQIQLYGAHIKRAAPEALQGEWFADSLKLLDGIEDADLLDEGDSFTIDDFLRVKMPKEADADWKLDIPSFDQHGEAQDTTKLPAIDGIILYSRNVRLYWQSAYGDGSTSPPDCKSTDGVTGEGTPAATATPARSTSGDQPPQATARLVRSELSCTSSRRLARSPSSSAPRPRRSEPCGSTA